MAFELGLAAFGELLFLESGDGGDVFEDGAEVVFRGGGGS